MGLDPSVVGCGRGLCASGGLAAGATRSFSGTVADDEDGSTTGRVGADRDPTACVGGVAVAGERDGCGAASPCRTASTVKNVSSTSSSVDPTISGTRGTRESELAANASSSLCDGGLGEPVTTR
ncbi:MAG: hypothetical protein RLZZ450_2387 [Pseudomonadota bacterium]